MVLSGLVIHLIGPTKSSSIHTAFEGAELNRVHSMENGWHLKEWSSLGDLGKLFIATGTTSMSSCS